MNVWILTIGNSDVQLLTEDNWLTFYDNEIMEQLGYDIFHPTSSDNQHRETWVAPARVLGMIYQRHLETDFDDLYFPLLNNFLSYFNENNKEIPDEIVYIMTDQANIFPDYLSNNKSACWKDTCTLQPIIEHFLKAKFPKAKLKPCILYPRNNQSGNPKGMDDWNSTLDVVRKSLSQLKYTNKSTNIYVSHQAGTPAISSALQFLSLAQYGKQVKFLVSNEYELNSAEIIKSSQYLRGIKIEQAKSLIPTSPGAAKKMLDGLDNIEPKRLEELQNFVDFFNLNRSLDLNQSEFEIESATQRIVDALDLIGIFFNQENYLQGITLLSAAQETFLKVAILTKVSEIEITLSNQSFSGIKALEWNLEGLLLSSWAETKTVSEKNGILKQLKFPENNPITNENKNQFKKTNSNDKMYDWLCQLETKFQPWSILQWSCSRNKKRENDLRNQLVHNLRGMEKTDAIQYLLGYKPSKSKDVIKVYDENFMKVYNEDVKDPFVEAIKLFKLPYTKEKLRQTLEKLADSLS
ncbi:hypothetical protein [Lyngbya sp. PCC 8106]|uniref:hypothetical protein n=1 Tax=Lyngbya sp. (strain PCC 8106) TaxID=313612 RepID=UPI0000EA98DE|nr:hypothetical protein [Lyngbya sp. PCC 8106]EAW35185.1 hypothetical protein L8106_13760 [Lyngbya sp. PCC 8106]